MTLRILYLFYLLNSRAMCVSVSGFSCLRGLISGSPFVCAFPSFEDLMSLFLL